MTWHLKDRELEKKLIAIDPDFIENLQKKEVVGTKAYSINFGDYVLSGSIGSPRFYAYFDKSELEDVPKYNPNAWNEYPEVTPPKRVLMRIEYKDSEGNLVRECAMFVDVVGAPLPSYWMTAKWNGKEEEEEIVEDAYRIDSNNYLIEDGMKLSFRPWSED